MINLRDWTARRSGANMTIKGTAESGETIIITGVVEISAGAPFPTARTADGATYKLGSTFVPSNMKRAG